MLTERSTAGWLWMAYGPAETFLAGAVFAGISLTGFVWVYNRHLK